MRYHDSDLAVGVIRNHRAPASCGRTRRNSNCVNIFFCVCVCWYYFVSHSVARYSRLLGLVFWSNRGTMLYDMSISLSSRWLMIKQINIYIREIKHCFCLMGEKGVWLNLVKMRETFLPMQCSTEKNKVHSSTWLLNQAITCEIDGYVIISPTGLYLKRSQQIR